MTSLSRQLRKLAAPQTSLLQLDKKKPSLLFDPLEAANLDRDAVYEIGLSGLEDLEKLDTRFNEFRITLYSLTSKQFERSVHTVEVNTKINEEIERFLVLLSPYFTLRSSQKALEWLVNRYHIHQFNTNAFIMCVLPFHDTNIFVRAIQLVGLKNQFSQWNWLRPLQKPGVPLPKNTLLNRCAKDLGLIKLICANLEKAIKIHSEKPSVLNIYIAFFTTTMIGMVEQSNGISEEQLAILLPSLLNGLVSKFPDLIAGCYMIIAQLNRKANLNQRVVEDLALCILKGMIPALSSEAITLLIVLWDKQKDRVFNVNHMRQCIEYLKSNAEFLPSIGILASCYQVSSFVSPVIQGFVMDLGMAFKTNRFNKNSQFLTKLVEDVRFIGKDPIIIVKSFVIGYLEAIQKIEASQKLRVQKEISAILDRLEKQYPVDFEKALHLAMIENAENEVRKEELSKLLGASWDVEHTSLFLKLNHNSTEVRLEAIRSVIQAMLQGKIRNMSFAVSSIVERLTDSNAQVVSEVLLLGETLLTILPSDRQFSILLAALANGQQQYSEAWNSVRLDLIKLLGSKVCVDKLSEDELVELFLALLPFLLATNTDDLKLTKAIVASDLKTHSPMLQVLATKIDSQEKNVPTIELSANSLHTAQIDSQEKNVPKIELTANSLHTAQIDSQEKNVPTIELSANSLHTAQIDSQEKNVPKIELTANSLHEALRQVKPFSSEQLNVKVFQRMLDCIRDSSTHSSLSLPVIFVVAALIQGETELLKATKMATRFVDVLFGMIESAMVKQKFNVEEYKNKPGIHAMLLQARSGSIAHGALIYGAMEVYAALPIEFPKMDGKQWAALANTDDPTDASMLFLLSLFRFLVFGLTSGSYFLFQSSFQTFFGRMMQTKSRLFFLSLVWNSPNADDSLKIVALKMGAIYLEQDATRYFWAIEYNSSVVPQLLCCLTSPNFHVREHALAIFKVLVTPFSTWTKVPCLTTPNSDVIELGVTTSLTKNYGSLIVQLLESAEEMKIDEDQVKVVLGRHLSKKAMLCYHGSALPSSTALFKLIVSEEVPDYVKQGLLKALEQVNSPSILTNLLPLIDELINKMDSPLGVIQSNVLTMLLERFNPVTAPLIATDEGWNCFQKALRSPTNAIITGEEVFLSPQDIIIEVITKDFFKALPSQPIKLKVFDELLEIIINTDKTVTARQARRALKRISFDATLLITQLQFKSQPSESTGVKGNELRGRRPRQPSLRPSQCLLWNRILAVLEMLQVKREISGIHLLIAPLFDLLKTCLDEEEQVSLEYSKQLILSCLLSCCQKLSPGDSVKLASEFNTGLIVQCIRVSNNPQTHHQALLLLSLAAQLFPSHVLHNIMAIFTFMGTSVLRQDDAYSFQVIAKTLESVIPTLIEASMKTAVEPVVTTVIHVFADALPEVPEHRRIPVFDKLLTTLDPEIYLWLAPTLILSNMATQGSRLGRGLVKEDDKDRIAPDVEFSLNVCHLYKPQVQLNACIRMIEYLQSLPVEKDERRRLTRNEDKDMTEGSTPFSLDVHSTRQLCHFKLLLVNFISTLLSSNRLVAQLVELDDSEKPSLEKLYQKLVETALEYTQSVSRQVDLPLKVTSAEQGPNPKFWRALLHRSYDVIDRINSLLPRAMFISVVHTLLSHPIPSIRRRAMELLSAKLQHQSNFFAVTQDQSVLLQLIPSLTAIASGQGSNEEEALNQQTAFFTLKLLCRCMGPLASSSFRPVLDVVVETISPSKTSSSTVLASAFLCLAELIQNMGVQSLPHLPHYGANIVSRLGDISSIESHDLLLLSVVTAVYKLVETLPQFLVPYLPPILKQICYLSAKQPVTEKPSQLQSRLQSIRHSLATASVPRSLVNSVTQVYAEVTMIESGTFVPTLSIAPLMSILSESFAAMSSEELTIQLPALTSFFIKALDTRSSLSVQQATIEQMNAAEEPVVSALVSLVLKLSEASFRPLFFQLYDWATRVTDMRKERLVTFYNLTMQIAEKLKGLFVVFAGHFIRNAAQVIVDTNFTQKGSLPFNGPHAEGNTLMLLEYVLRCLYRVCLHDNENFINKERFETLMEPLVDQLENQLGEEEVVKRRVKDLLVPLLAQMAVAASDDYLWKALHYQLLLKTRSNSPHVRLGSLSALSALVEKLGEDYLALLPEAIPFLAELLEDDVNEVEVAAQTTIANMENMLGEPLQKYF